ncbi:MAG: glycosyltransferase family 4 protein [Planctomycetes bacterium]|nr:glycosyltransferase family 4 protein [Planctomycetota bacterium]
MASFFVSHRLRLALKAQEAGYDVHVATPPGPGLEEIEAAGLPCHTFSLSRSSTEPWAEARTLAALAGVYRRVRPGLAHHVAVKPVAYGGLVARALRVPAVVHALAGLGYSFTSRSIRARLLRASIPSLLRLACGAPNARVLVQNPDDRAFCQHRLRTPANQISLIKGSGVDLERFRPTPEPAGPVRVVMAARMLWDKGVHEFLEAARLLSERGLNIKMTLVGGTDLENPSGVSVERLRAWQSQGLVEWWDHRDDMPAVLESAHVVCLPSYREGLPKVLVEAAAAGRPIVTTDVPGCRDVVSRGNGLLVPARSGPALANAIAQLASDSGLRASMGARGRTLAEEELGLETVIEQTLRVYELARHGTRA